MDAASKTLGFWPIFHTEVPKLPTPNSLTQGLNMFLKCKHGIPEATVKKMKFTKIFKEESSSTLFVEFPSDIEVNTVFKYIRCLPKDCKVCRYILPKLQDKHRALSEKAKYIKTANTKSMTKILYDNDSIRLFIKKHGDNTWRPAPESDGLVPSTVSLSILPQLDGLDDSISTSQSPDNISLSRPSNTHQSGYTLNQDKQSARICKDATKDDIEIIVNNNDTNVNIQCSAGFYIMVARPCLLGYNEGSVSQYSTTQVTCSEVFFNYDQAGVSDFTRLSFILRGSDMSIIGTVKIHLRHTTRLIQVQGGAKMSDKSTSAVWFTENFLCDTLKQLAKSRHYDISAFNQRILEMSRSHHHSVKSGKTCVQCQVPGQTQPLPFLQHVGS